MRSLSWLGLLCACVQPDSVPRHRPAWEPFDPTQPGWQASCKMLLVADCQVHNLLSWQEHLPVLMEMKAAGRVRHVGITTSEGRRMRDIEQIMRAHPIDFVQVTYSLADRRAEDRILPLARERGIAVIANRPFEQGELLRALARHALPPIAAELQCTSWAQFALKFVASHPDVTCAIPATTSVAHVRENLAAGLSNLPDLGQRNRMTAQTAGLL